MTGRTIVRSRQSRFSADFITSIWSVVQNGSMRDAFVVALDKIWVSRARCNSRPGFSFETKVTRRPSEANPIRTRVLTLSLAALVSGSTQVPLAQAADFYAGKTLNILASSEAGGGYDTYSRLLARHIGKHLPGNPTTVVMNVPGGGGLRAAQQIYSVVPKDGLTIANLRSSTMLDSVLKIRADYIDPTKYEWIGSMTNDTDVCVFSPNAGIKTFQDLQSKQVVIGASGAGSQSYSFANALNSVFGLKMKMIAGYKGTGERIIAMEKGEVQGNCGVNASTIGSVYSQLLANGQIIPILQSGLRPYSALPDVPLTQSFATNETQKKVLLTIFSQMEIARVFAAPPGTPADLVATLRTAFMATMRDPDLLREAKAMNLYIDVISGEEVQKIIAAMSDVSDELRAQVRKAIGE